MWKRRANNRKKKKSSWTEKNNIKFKRKWFCSSFYEIKKKTATLRFWFCIPTHIHTNHIMYMRTPIVYESAHSYLSMYMCMIQSIKCTGCLKSFFFIDRLTEQKLKNSVLFDWIGDTMCKFITLRLYSVFLSLSMYSNPFSKVFAIYIENKRRQTTQIDVESSIFIFYFFRIFFFFNIHSLSDFTAAAAVVAAATAIPRFILTYILNLYKFFTFVVHSRLGR